MSGLDVATIKRDFPILEREVNGKRLVYLDSASSSQKPLAVLDAMDDAYRNYYANIHRGVYTIAEEATAAYEHARRKVARFVNARATEEIIFTRNATEGINLVAYSWARANLREGDVIVLSHMEHHANVVPWHMLAAERACSCAGSRSPPTTGSTSRTSTSCSTAPSCSRSARCPMSWARSTTSRSLARRSCGRRPRTRRRVPVRPARRHRRAGMGRRLRGLLRTRCSARAASARSGRGTSSSRRCRRSSAAAR